VANEQGHRTASAARRFSAELVGSGLLAALVIGSGIAAQRLSPDDLGLQLLENAFATALGLPVLILLFATVSGSHFNPVVTLVDVLTGGRRWTDAGGYIPAQVIGCILGAILANLMFGDPAISISTTDRLTPGTFLGEIVATAGLIMVIFVLARTGRHPLVPWAVGAYIGAAYFFTSSASFANPAITIGRIFSDTFAGIAPGSAPGFIAAQLIGALVGLGLVLWFDPAERLAIGGASTVTDRTSDR
jgi:glycerol uptake facilitator-like aquaporin